MATPLNPTLEPRVNKAGMQSPPNADHPFFWAGFLLADTGAQNRMPTTKLRPIMSSKLKTRRQPPPKPLPEKPPEKK